MPLTSIRQARRLLGAPRKQYLWEVVIPNPPPAVFNFVPSFSLRARNAIIPGYTNETFDTRCGPFTFTHPGRKGYPRRLTITFEEGYLFPVLPGIHIWEEMITSETTGGGLPESQLLADCWIRLLGERYRSLTQATYGMHFYGVSPVSSNEPPLDYSGSGIITLAVTFAYDYWRLELWPF